MLSSFMSICVFLNAFVQAPLPTDRPTEKPVDKPVAKASRQLYEQAAKAIASADARSAIEPLEKLLDDSSSPLATIAAVHLAECYIAVDRAGDAIKVLQTWSPHVAANVKQSDSDAQLYLHHHRVWMQAAKRTAPDDAAIRELTKLVETIAADTEASADSADSAELAAVNEILTTARYELARRLVANGRLGEAVTQLDLVTESDKVELNAEACLLHAVVLQQTQEPVRARELFERLSEVKTPSISRSLARLELANYALQESDTTAAEKYLRPLIASQITRRANRRVFKKHVLM